jgi:predicted NAD/FAD-binding protein
MNTEIFWAIVPWLAVLACPAMMLFMMRGMPGGSCHKQPAEAKVSGGADDEIRRLQARVAELEARNRLTEVSR